MIPKLVLFNITFYYSICAFVLFSMVLRVRTVLPVVAGNYIILSQSHTILPWQWDGHRQETVLWKGPVNFIRVWCIFNIMEVTKTEHSREPTDLLYKGTFSNSVIQKSYQKLIFKWGNDEFPPTKLLNACQQDWKLKKKMFQCQ